jgi:Fe-S-cluster containining protein
MCGTCCKKLVLVDGRKIVRTEEEFRLLKKKYPEYEMFKLKSTNSDGDLVFECSKLNEDNTCSIHENRPDICTNYPTPAMFKHRGKLFKKCGYYVEPAVDFQEILDSK